jgi:hypothetical protein
VAKLRPLFVMFGGDYMTDGSAKKWAEWLDDWQETISEDGRLYPLLPAMGNHEYFSNRKKLSMLSKLFDIKGDDGYYALSFCSNMLRTYVLNSELGRTDDQRLWDAQSKWLMQDLSKYKRSAWKVAMYHRPMRPHTKSKKEGSDLMKAWAYLFYEFGMDLALESDTHLCKRTYPISPSTKKGSDEGFIRDDQRGTTYVGEGGWGAPVKKVNDSKSWTLDAGSFWQFKWIQVTPKKLTSVVVKFENVDEVQALTDKTRFKRPKGIVLWEPKGGSVLTLDRRKK